jgi:hypothetical protein
MMSSEHRENDRAFPACVTNLHIIATTHHRSVVRARACWRSHRTRSGCALSQRAIDGVAQDEEPGERDGAPGARGGVAVTLAGLHPAPSGGSPSGCTSGALTLTGGGSSPASSLSLAAASTSPAATAASEVVFAILSSATAASRAWSRFLNTGRQPHHFRTNAQPNISFRSESIKMNKRTGFPRLSARSALPLSTDMGPRSKTGADAQERCEMARRTYSGSPALRNASRNFIRTSGERGPDFASRSRRQSGDSRRQSATTL